MTEQLGILFFVGITFGIVSLYLGFYSLGKEQVKLYINLIFVTLGILSIILLGIDAYNTMIDQQDQEKTISANIENMSCTQLHDALLHNTINGTSHIQRATERYVAGCESK